MEFVEMILYKKVNNGDLLNIDREIFEGATGGGQTYFDLGGIDQVKLSKFLEYGIAESKENPEKFEYRKKYTIEVIKLGNEEIVASLEFDPRNGRKNYKISDQRNNRHPAWLPSNGFPRIPEGARYASDITNIPNLFIFIIKTSDKKYYAGFVNNNIPKLWDIGIGLERLLVWDKKDSNKGFIDFEPRTILFTNNIDKPFSITQQNSNQTNIELSKDIETKINNSNYIENEENISLKPTLNLKKESIFSEDETFEIDFENIQFEQYMPPNGTTISKMPSGLKRQGRKINYEKKNKQNKIKGDLGEEIVLELERVRLKSLGMDDFIDTIEWVSKSKGDGLGYDIESWDIYDGKIEKIYIEVKTTIGKIDTPIDISAKEVEVSKQLGDKYYIYRIFGIKKVNNIINYYIINGDITKTFDLVPSAYKAYLK
ncbi:DUF3883 domain-containing protein [Clostridium perfringens]|nr:DUF3883 domain-containing protein [Clostridium perfringens]MDM0931849.1 DUF3883 domain-containing protein [Clostridium perfringens]